MNKQELLILFSKIKKYDLNEILNINDEYINILKKIEDENIFDYAINIILGQIQNKSFILNSLIKVKDKDVARIIYEIAPLSLKNKEFIIDTLINLNYGKARYMYRIMTNKIVVTLNNYKDIINIILNEKNINKINFINSIFTSDYVLKNLNNITNIIEKIIMCKDEKIGFIFFKLLSNDNLCKLSCYNYLLDKIIMCRNIKHAEELYSIMTDNNMQKRNDFIEIIDLLDQTIKNKGNYKITILSKLMDNNEAELKDNLKLVDNDVILDSKTLVLIIK